MFKITDTHRTVTAAFGAVLVSFAFIGASVGPVRTSALTAAHTTVASGQTQQA